MNTEKALRSLVSTDRYVSREYWGCPVNLVVYETAREKKVDKADLSYKEFDYEGLEYRT